MEDYIPSFVIAYSNSDFTNPHEVVLPGEPDDRTKNYSHMGVCYCGLETKRHLTTDLDAENKRLYFHHDRYNFINIGFKKRALLKKLRISTKWFTGNQVRSVSVRAFDELLNTETEILSTTLLQPDTDHEFIIPDVHASSCFVKIYYEGGIARINFFGEEADKQLPEKHNVLEEATISNVSDEHYGNPAMAVKGNREENYMKGWESARTGFGEKAVFHLKKAAYLEEVIVDTYLHRLNAPLSCHIFGINQSDDIPGTKLFDDIPKWKVQFKDGTIIIPEDFKLYMNEQLYLKEKVNDPEHFEIKLDLSQSKWKPVLPFEALFPDRYHRFNKLENSGPFTHLLYMHYPNGGIHGLKVFGTNL